MLKRTNRRIAPLLVGAILGLGLPPLAPATAVRAEDETLPMRFNAQAVNMSNIGGRGTSTARLDITVNRWSTDEERSALLEALKEGGRRSLPDALVSQDRVGSIREVSRRAEFLRYSRRIPLADGGQQIILGADRPMGFLEMSRSLRTQDYNVTVIQLTLNADGEGEGSIMLGAQLSWDAENERIVVEGFATQPIRLTRVRLR